MRKQYILYTYIYVFTITIIGYVCVLCSGRARARDTDQSACFRIQLKKLSRMAIFMRKCLTEIIIILYYGTYTYIIMLLLCDLYRYIIHTYIQYIYNVYEPNLPLISKQVQDKHYKSKTPNKQVFIRSASHTHAHAHTHTDALFCASDVCVCVSGV